MKLSLARTHVPLVATALVASALYAATALTFPAFLTWRVFIGLFSENAILGVVGVGMTFVILSGGIDLSVGAIVGCVSIALARLIAEAGWHPGVAIAAMLAAGALYGGLAGALIHYGRLPAFLVTLAGMFLARGLGFIVSQEARTIHHSAYDRFGDFSFAVFPGTALIFGVALVAAMLVARFTRFGRNVYAVGGSESSARLMGLPVAGTRLTAYALSGVCAAAGGVLYTLYTQSGKASAGEGLELEAIAVVVIGGTLLSGGVGSVFGTLLGVLIYAIIQAAIMFHGELNSWWTKIAIGALLLGFVLLQRVVQARVGARA